MKKRTFKFITLLIISSIIILSMEPLSSCGAWLKEAAKALEGIFVEDVYADDTVSYSFLMGSREINDGGEIDYSLYSTSDRSLSIQLKSSAGIASGTAITWSVSNDNIIQIEQQNDNTCSVKLKIISPGYSGLSVSLADSSGTVYSAVAYCSIYVPLEWSDNVSTGNNNIIANIANGEYYGLFSAQTGDTAYTLQMYTKDSADFPNCDHYLRMLKYVGYNYTVASGKNGQTVKSNIDPEELDRITSALTWESSDTSVVTVDSLTGMIRAVSAGFATITVSTNTINERLSINDSLSFNVIVVPEGIVSGYTTQYKDRGNVTINPADTSIVIQTNAKFASNLSWKLFQGDQAINSKDITKTYKSNIEIGEATGRVVLTDLPAGVYYLTAIAQKDAAAARTKATYDVTAANIRYFGYVLIVPLNFATNKLILNYYNKNQFDSYDLLGASNAPPGTFRFTSSDINVAKVGTSSGVVEASGVGGCTITINKVSNTAIENIFGVYASNPAVINYDGNPFNIDVSVVNGVTISSTNETMPVGSSTQLYLVSPSPYEGDITWKVTTESQKYISVDEYGKVTALAATPDNFTAVVIVEIKVNGVRKQARCYVKVTAAVNQITLNSKDDFVAVGENLTISATTSPKINNAKLSFACSDESIASVVSVSDLSVTISGVKVGTVVVSAINADNLVVATKVIRVVQDITGLVLSDVAVTLPKTANYYQLYATCTPALPENQKLNWSSSDTKVATVDENGKVKLIKPGTCVITCVTENGLLANCTFTITQGVTGIKLDETEINMRVGDKQRLSYVLLPANASNTTLKWTSLDPKVATVDSGGYLVAKNVGTTMIMVQATDGTGIYTTCKVNVSRLATGIKLDVSVLTMNVGESYLLETTLTPADSSDIVSYESSNSKVATVTKTGKISAKGKGNCVILAKTEGGISVYCTVNVIQQVTGVTLDVSEATIEVGDELQLEATIAPKTASDTEVTWTSTNTKAAKVDKNGLVTGLEGGVTLVKVVTTDGDFMAYCVITVVEKVTDIHVQETAEVGVGKKLTLEATIENEKATNKNVTWESNDTDIVMVNEKGVIIGVNEGTCIVTVTAADGSGSYAECEVTVISATESINIDPSMTYIELIVGESKTIKYTVDPDGATYQPLWESSDPKIAVVNKNGQVTGLKAGTITVTASAKDNPEIKEFVTVKVSEPVLASSVVLSDSELIMIPGETKGTIATTNPTNITESHTWTSDNPVVASVDTNGLITAKSIGSANVTYMTKSGKKATVKVFVVGLSETSVTLAQYEELLLDLQIDGTGSNNLTVRWGTKNQLIAEMRNGHVTAKAVGTTKVYAKVNGRSLECKVTVVKNQKRK